MNLRLTSILPLLVVLWTTPARGQGSFFAVEESGPRRERVNFVFFSEGYNATDLPNFAGHVDAAVAYLFSREPWKQYRSYCNVYRIEVASAQSGCDYGSTGGLRDTYFNCGFNTPAIPQLITSNLAGRIRALDLLLEFVPEADIPIFLVNDAKYGGGGGSIAIASAHALSPQIVEHEIGHTFATLGDEYDTYIPSQTPQEYPNVTAETVRSLVKWGAWVDPGTPEPTPATSQYDGAPGLFEGAGYRPTGWYRPHLNSLMRTLGRPIGQINRERFVLSIYSVVHPAESRSPENSYLTVEGPQQLSFSVVPKQPVFWSLQTQWYIDSIPVEGAVGNVFETDSDGLGRGYHTVTVEIFDPTDFVRNDPNQLLRQRVTWDVEIRNLLPADLASWRAAYGPDSDNPAGDGVSNLVKYALGIDPDYWASPWELPELYTEGGAPESLYQTLWIPRRMKHLDITYIVEASSNLIDWDSETSVLTLVDEDDLLLVQDAFPVGSLAFGRRFLRLRIEAPPEPP